MGLIRRTFVYIDKTSFKTLFSTLVRPHLEYCGVVIYPRLIQDKRRLENVLRKASKLVPGLRNLSYENRLAELNMPSMRYRLIRGDLIEIFKWCKGFYTCTPKLIDAQDRSLSRRGHFYTITRQHSRLEIRHNFLTLRAAERWNNLPQEVVSAKTLNTFKNLLDCARCGGLRL